MHSQRRTILRNASSLFGAQLLTWITALAGMVFVARHLGPAISGQLFLATSIWTIVSIFIDLGMNTALVKQIARTPESTPRLFATTVLIRLGMFIPGCLLVGVYSSAMGYTLEAIAVIFLIGIAQLFWSLGNACNAVLQGIESMEYMSIADVASKVVNAILSIVAIYMDFGLLSFVIITVFSALVGLTIQLMAVWRVYPPILHFNITEGIAMMRSGLPYLLSGASLVIYGQLDVFMLSHLVDTQAVGWYSVASRLFGTLLFIPSIFVTVLFPSLSRAHVSDPSSLIQFIRRSFDLMLLISVPVGLGLIVIGQPAIDLLFGAAFAPGGQVLSMFGIVAIFSYLNILSARYLYAIDRQKIWAFVMLAATLVTIPLNLLLIPWCDQILNNGALGGVLSFIITEGAMLIIALFLLPRGALGRQNAYTAFKIVLAGMLMAGSAWFFRDQFIAIPIAVGIVTYTPLVLFLRILPSEEIKLLSELVRSRFQRSAQKASDVAQV